MIYKTKSDSYLNIFISVVDAIIKTLLGIEECHLIQL